ncbi:hypothetical protein [Treponema sp.]|uniref:hypothetical protein n=1 Tax=Treponema sp. TaxID=166 RepID=UPI00298E3D9F|nr:hypothetical protein [Treponema sp.]MCQ2241102.1 hypothetical protein [Treponema sp.]
MKKLLFVMFACCASFAFSQSNDEEKIQLPEMTTTVSGDTVVAGRDAVPDFSKVVPSAGEEKNIMPKLPGERITYEDDGAEPEADFFSGDNKNVYAQGLVGGGFPGDFIGEFSVYKSSNTDPFRIEFSHFSRNGYGKHTAADGYFDNGTKLYAEKTFHAADSEFTFGGRYDRVGTGLQGLNDYFYDMNSQKVSGVFLFDHFFGDSGFEFSSETNAYWYNRYAGIINDGDFLKQERNINVFYTDPGFVFSWYSQGFSAGLECNFQIESFLGKHDDAYNDDLFRVDGTLFTGYESDIVTAFARGGIAGGTEIGEGRTIVPSFSTGAEVRAPLSTGRKLVIGVNGGLETRHDEFSVLERKYKFAQMTTLTKEISDWFVNSKIVIPLFDVITVNSGIEFKKSAFDNYAWEADYSTKKGCGVFGFKSEERTQVTTDNGISIKYDIFTLRGGWRAHWWHVPSNEYRHSIEGSIAYDDELERWGFSAGVIESVDSKSDKCPNLRGNIYVNIKKAMRLSLEMDDVIKLFSRKDREYVESGYLVRAGSVTFLSRFFF